MSLNVTKRSLLAVVSGCLILGSAITGCSTNTQSATTTTPSPTSAARSTSPAPTQSSLQQWITILKGESAQELTFSEDGKLLYQGQTLLNEIPVSYGSDGSMTHAQRLIVSDPSPSGRFNVVKACEETTNESGLCWTVFLIDRQAQTVEKIDIAKYGGQEWVQWSADERYAVFAESMEGVTWFVALDLQTRETKISEQTASVADLSSFSWIDDRTFQVNLVCGDRADCTTSQFRGDITALFAQ